MTKRFLVQLSMLGVGAFLGLRVAIPCSLIAPSETAGPFGMTGSRPLLIAENSASPALIGGDRSFAVEPATPDARLAAALGARANALSFFMPADPLPPGDYTFDGGRVAFSVTASSTDQMPALGSSGSIQIFVSDGDEGGGCFGQGVSSCGDTSNVTISVERMTDGGTYLLELSTAEGESFSRLVSDRFATNQFLFYGAFKEIGKLEDVTICATVTPVSPAGVLGETLDVGCAEGH